MYFLRHLPLKIVVSTFYFSSKLKGQSSVIKPIPTPSRSYLLSTFRTIFFSPLLVMGIMPETNEIEVSIFGGSNRPFRSINKTDEIDFIIESCDLQVLDAKVIF
jgi:hypothetical protein